MGLLVKREFVPDKLKEVYVDFYWSQKKLWELQIPTVSLEINRLDWILDYPVWYMDQNSVPRMILADPYLDQSHWERIQNADLNYPIHVISHKSRMLILDGVHRLMKATLLGQNEIMVKILEESCIENILPDKEDFEKGFLKQFERSAKI